MKSVIISLLLFLTVQAQVHYLGTEEVNTTGIYDGTSWERCWTLFDNIDQWGSNSKGIVWTSINAGDTIYIHGGVDSATYRPYTEGGYHLDYGIQIGYSTNDTVPRISFAGGDKVVLCPSWEDGHNGTPYILTGSTPSSPVFKIANVSNIQVSGLTIVDERTSGSGIVQLGGGQRRIVDGGYSDSLIYFTDNHIIGKGLTEVCYIAGTKTTFQNNIIENLANDLPNSQDPLTMSSGGGNHIIDGNIIILRNSCDTTDAHRDMIQISNTGYGVTENKITISNNFCISTTEAGNHWNNMIYCYADTGTAHITLLIYNNIFVNRKNNTGIGGVGLGRFYVEGEGYRELATVKFYNNTFISKGANSGGMFTGWALDTLIIKNNLFVKDSTAPNIVNVENGYSLWQGVHKDIDYNYYGVYGGTQNPFAVVGDNKTWAEWLTELNFDGSHIDSAGSLLNSSSITFVSKYDINASSYYTTTGRDAGVDLSVEAPFLSTDILGNSRSGTWDIGALEYVSGAVVDSLPNDFTLTNVSNAELNTTYYAQTGNLEGFDSAYVHISAGEYNINGASYVGSDVWTKVFENDDAYLRFTTGSSYDSVASITLTIGSRVKTWTITTKSAPINPNGIKIVKVSNGKTLKDRNGKIVKVGSSSYTPPAEPDNTPPDPPTSFLATNSGSASQFLCTWNESADTDTIRLYEGSSDDTTTMVWVATITNGSEQYLRTGREASTTYWCAVKAVDDSGNVSYFSNTNSVITAGSESGTPLASLDLVYLTQSFGQHLYNHSTVGSAGTTDMPAELSAYNSLYGTSATITRPYPNGEDYPACGDMIWDWNQVFYGGTGEGNVEPTQNVLTEYAIPETYTIISVNIGFNSGGMVDMPLDTVTYPQGHLTGNYKYFIRNMVAVMELYPDKYWVLWNIPPVVEGAGNSASEVNVQADFNAWMVDTLQAGLDSYGAFPDNVFIFDVFSLLKNSGNNYMNDSYADGEEDSHPNAAGQDVVAPVYIQQVFDKARAYRIP